MAATCDVHVVLSVGKVIMTAKAHMYTLPCGGQLESYPPLASICSKLTLFVLYLSLPYPLTVQIYIKIYLEPTIEDSAELITVAL